MKSKSRSRKLTEYVLLAVLGALLLFNCATLAISLLGLRGPLAWLPGTFMKVDSGSMAPDLYEGDLIFVWKVPFEELSVGDTVTTYARGTYTTHRIVRLADEKIVTKGLVNALEDTPVGSDAYVAKEIFCLRGMGTVYEALTSGWACAVWVVILLCLFFGKPLYRALLRKTGKLRVGAVRVTACLTAVSAAILPPVSTLAKFTGTVSAGKTAAAAEINFSSNYLSAEGNAYDIAGWNGEDYSIDIKIFNYSNALKYNVEDVNLSYIFEFEKITEENGKFYTRDYTLTAEPQQGFTEDMTGSSAFVPAPVYTPNDICAAENTSVVIGQSSGIYTIDGGAKTYQSFRITANGMSGGSLRMGDGEKVKFRVKARSLDSEGYVQTLTADFTLTVSTATSFIESRSLDQSKGSAVVRYTIKSATLIGVPEKRVVIEWDSSLLYLNTYQTTVWNMLNGGTCLYTENEDGKGSLDFVMSATSSITLEFFKYTAKLEREIDHSLESIRIEKPGEEGYDEYELLRLFEKAAEPADP